MDSITQATLGAAVGEAVLGKKAGYKAAAWGAVLGIFPDLDVLASPFLDTVNDLYFHRNITHSFVFCIAIAPVFGWTFTKIHSQLDVNWKQWANLAFWVILTHILIDVPTTYGTQVFQPFTNYLATTDSVFIIDPLFTIPLLIGVISARAFRSSPKIGRYLNYAGLFVGAMYLFWGFGVKAHVHSVFQESFKNQYGYFDQIKTSPNGPTTFLWSGYIVKQDTVYQSIYSVFDETTDLKFQAIPQNSHLIEPYKEDRALEALLWFSGGYYTVKRSPDDDIILYDLRFGRDDFWLNTEGEFVWGNRLIFDENGNAYTFEQTLPSFDVRARNLRLFWDRIWGK